jgi:hypothetical protein
MNCGSVEKNLALFLYGELSFDEEESVHAHLDECEACRKALAAEKALHAAADRQELEPSPALLRQCRENLRIRVAEEAAYAGLRAEPRRPASFFSLFDGLAAMFAIPVARWAMPLGGLALLAAGFFSARLTSPVMSPQVARLASEPMSARVRYVEPDNQGRVQIVVDETRQRVLSGSIDDAQIRRLLLAAAKDPADGLRVETVGILNQRSAEADFRHALVHALQHDSNDGVRLKALSGLKMYAHEPDVRTVLAEVLLRDGNPGIRGQAIDLLTQPRAAGAASDPKLAGVLQDILRQASDGYVRLRCERALEEMKASRETY